MPLDTIEQSDASDTEKGAVMSTPVQLQSDETVIDTIKRHPVHLWFRELAIVVVVIIVLVLWYNFGLGSTGTVGTFWNVLAIGAVVVGLIMGYSYWYRYNNDVWLITSQRLVDSTKTTPFSQNVHGRSTQFTGHQRASTGYCAIHIPVW